MVLICGYLSFEHSNINKREIFKLAGTTNYETRIFLVMFWRLTFKNFRRKSLAWHSFEVWLSAVHLLAVTGLVLSSPTEENKTHTQKRLSLAKLKSQPISTNHQWKLVNETTYNTLAKRLVGETAGHQSINQVLTWLCNSFLGFLGLSLQD